MLFGDLERLRSYLNHAELSKLKLVHFRVLSGDGAGVSEPVRGVYQRNRLFCHRGLGRKTLRAIAEHTYKYGPCWRR